MSFLIVSASPNRDGLTAACAQAAAEGIRSAGAEVEEVRLAEAGVGMCRACGNGWGPCRQEHRCQTEDGFQQLHARAGGADGLVLVTPVYWGELAESARAFTDRLRRCEASRGRGTSLLAGKPVIAVAAAGGSGNGTVSCLASMERWIQHVQARPFDLIPVNRWSRTYKLAAIKEAGRAMVLNPRPA